MEYTRQPPAPNKHKNAYSKMEKCQKGAKPVLGRQETISIQAEP